MAGGQQRGRKTGGVSKQSSCFRDVFLWKQSSGSGGRLGSRSRTPNWGRGTRTQDRKRRPKRSGTPGLGKGVGEGRDCTLGTEERTGWVGSQARKRKREGGDPRLRKVTDELGLG